MIEIIVKQKSSTALIQVRGHAGFDTLGKDIVCAAVSTACILSANLIERLDLMYDVIALDCTEGFFQLEVKKENKTAFAVFENLDFTLDELQKQYPKYIKYKN